ncbi:MAG: ABC transporter ATP-binding protein [Actinomycetota bacterium]|nr:ABC transporter ATP-binding protein [Actinomycetota bacterium]
MHKRFGSTVALAGFDLDLRRGILLALLGPSGCGKTTALRVMAGFERPTGGDVCVGGEHVAGTGAWVPPERRRIGMVFQDWALFPHLDVWHNAAFGIGRDEGDRVQEVLRLVDLQGLERRLPHELSGGQQQRVALARALAPSPEVILLDEPFSNLDATLRASVRAEVRQVLREAGATAIFVTHDQEEALSMADELAVMVNGRVVQVGAPHEVYGMPADSKVAALVGEANFFKGIVRDQVALTPVGDMPAPGLSDGPVEVMVRPEAVRLTHDEYAAARIVDAEFYGHDQLVRAVLADGTSLDARLLGPRPELMIGSPVAAAVVGGVHFFREGRPVLATADNSGRPR